MKYSKIILLHFFMFFSFALMAQRPHLEMNGLVKENGIPLAGVRVYIISEGGIISEDTSDVKGKFKVKSYYSKLLTIYFEKQGYITQNFQATTNLIGVSQSDMTVKVAMDMHANPKVDSVITFTKAVHKLEYNNNSGKFEYNAAYELEIKPKILELEKKLALLNSAVVVEAKKEE